MVRLASDVARVGGTMRVLIVDEHRLFAEAIHSALSGNGHGMQLLPVATTAEEGLGAARRGRPDVALVDLGLRDGSGIDLGREILDSCQGVTLLAVTARSDPRLFRESLRAGFHGCLTKDTPMGDVLRSIEAARSGEVVVPQRLAATSAGVMSSEERDARLLAEQLTTRERDVLAMLVEGARSEGISERMAIRPNTVRTHIQNIFTKLQAHTRLEAAVFAVKYGLAEIPGERRRPH